MWREDKDGIELSGPKEAFAEFRTRAQRAIAEGDRQGVDVRTVQARLRNDVGEVLFEGTIADAARLEIDGRIYLPASPRQ